MIQINNTLLNEVLTQAENSDRQRINYNFHQEMSDPINRMLHALIPGTYVQPHKHENPDKREIFIILTGRVVMVYYDNKGNISGHYILDPDKNDFGLEIPPGTWHSLIALSPSVLYEVKDGPYDPSDDKHFAIWAPKEGDPGCTGYINRILIQLKLI